jgi:hypothetical protein
VEVKENCMCDSTSELQKLFDKLNTVIEFVDDEQRLEYLNELVDYEVACIVRELELKIQSPDSCSNCCGNCCKKEVDCNVDHTTDFSVEED